MVHDALSPPLRQRHFKGASLCVRGGGGDKEQGHTGDDKGGATKGCYNCTDHKIVDRGRLFSEPFYISMRSLFALMYTVHCTLYTIRYTLYAIRCTLYAIRCTLYAVRYTLYTIDYTLYAIHYTLYAIRCTLYAIHCTLSLHLRHEVHEDGPAGVLCAGR